MLSEIMGEGTGTIEQGPEDKTSSSEFFFLA
jgi:hypothetical protein